MQHNADKKQYWAIILDTCFGYFSFIYHCCFKWSSFK